MSAQIPTRQRRWLGLQMLEGDIYSRAYAGDAAPRKRLRITLSIAAVKRLGSAVRVLLTASQMAAMV
jgi:hypothetical protein